MAAAARNAQAQLIREQQRQQEQTTRLAQTKQRIVEVNTRLQAKAAQRSRIRHTALRTHAQLQSDLTIQQHGWRSMNVTACGAEIAGWRAHFAQLNRDKHQIATLAARIAELRQKLAGMPLCESEATIKSWKAIARSLRPENPAHCAAPVNIPPLRRIRRLNSPITSGAGRAGKEVAALKEEVCWCWDRSMP